MGGRIKDTGPCKGQTAAAYACHRTSGGMIRLQKLPDVRRIGRCPDATAYHDKHIRCPSDNLIQSMRNHGLQPALRTDNSSLGGEKTDIKAVKGYSRSGDKRVFPVCESLRQYKRNLCQLQPPSLMQNRLIQITNGCRLASCLQTTPSEYTETRQRCSGSQVHSQT